MTFYENPLRRHSNGRQPAPPRTTDASSQKKPPAVTESNAVSLLDVGQAGKFLPCVASGWERRGDGPEVQSFPSRTVRTQGPLGHPGHVRRDTSRTPGPFTA